MLGDKLPAEQAESWGLIWKTVDDEKLMDEAAKLGRHLATQPTRALGSIKKALHAAEANSLDRQLDLERRRRRRQLRRLLAAPRPTRILVAESRW